MNKISNIIIKTYQKSQCLLKNKKTNSFEKELAKRNYLDEYNVLLSKIEACSDPIIKAEAEKIIDAIKNNKIKDKLFAIDKIEFLIDTINNILGKYTNIYEASKPIDISAKKARTHFSEPMKLALLQKQENSFEILRKMNYENRYSALREFIGYYINEQEINNYLWERYYLPRFDAENQKFLREINNNFNVKIFSQENLTKSTLLIIKEELSLHKQYSQGKAKLPAVLNICDDSYMIEEQRKIIKQGLKRCIIDGYVDRTRHTITTNCPSSITLRHEITHLNEKSSDGNKMNFTRKEIRELLNAGLKKGDIRYAMTEDEANATFSQADMSKISEELKEKFRKNNFPEYELHLPYFETIRAKYNQI